MGSETETILINRRTTTVQHTDNNKTSITNLSSCHNDYLKKPPNNTTILTNNNNNNGNILSSSSSTTTTTSSASSIKPTKMSSSSASKLLSPSATNAKTSTITNNVGGGPGIANNDHHVAGAAATADDDEDEITPHIHHNHNHMLPANVGTDHTFKRKIVWFNAIGFLLLHMVGIAGVFTMILGYTKFATTIYFLFLTFASGMGITAGAHRLFSHRSYKAATWLRVTLLLLHTMAGQNCLYVWVRDHRQHHKYSDTDADPHNATRGFFFSHIGWLMSRKHPKVLEYGKKIDMSDMDADPWIMFQKKYYKTLYFIFVILIPTSIPCLLWNENVILAMLSTYLGRTILQLNFTWSVNSVAHMFGDKPYDKNMLPVESSLVSFFAGGEGWHNYHHTFPWDYRAAELGMPLNITTRLIDYFAKNGHVFDRKSVTNDMLRTRIQRTGDGSHEKFGIEALKAMNSSDEPLLANEHEISNNNNNYINNNNNHSNQILNNNNNIHNLNSLSSQQQHQHSLKKYIVDKNEINKIHLLENIEKITKIDDLNNNCANKKFTDLTSVKDLNRLVDNHQTFQPNNKQALNVCNS